MNFHIVKHMSTLKTSFLQRINFFQRPWTNSCPNDIWVYIDQSWHQYIIKCKFILEMKVDLPFISMFPSLFLNGPSQTEKQAFICYFIENIVDLLQVQHDKKCSNYHNIHRCIAEAFCVQLMGVGLWGALRHLPQFTSLSFPFVFTLTF